MEVLHFEQLDSTNEEAKRQLDAGRIAPFAIIAQSQSRGRGRLGRSWVSDAGDGVYMTYAERTDRMHRPLTLAPLAIGCGLADWLRDLGVPVHLKWPNDLRVNQAKLGGILCELRRKVLLAGVGVNWVQTPSSLDQLATCAQEHMTRRVDLSVAQGLMPGLVRGALDWWCRSGSVALQGRWWNLAERGTFQAGSVVGEPVGLAADGALLLRDASGDVHDIHAGDVLEVSG